MLGAEAFGRPGLATAPRLSIRAAATLALTELRANEVRAFLWAPVAFGLGAAAYLEAGREPSLWLLSTIALGLAAVWWTVRRRGAPAVVVAVASLAAFGAAGALAAKIRSDRVAAPIMAGERVVWPGSAWFGGWMASSSMSSVRAQAGRAC